MLDVDAAWIEGSKESDLEAIRQAMESSPRARAQMASGGRISGAGATSATVCAASALVRAVSPTARATSAPSPGGGSNDVDGGARALILT